MIKKLATSYLVFFVINGLLATSIHICDTCAINSLVVGLDHAEPGDTIFLEIDSSIVDLVELSTPITIIGIDRPVIKSKQGDEILRILSSNVSLYNLNFTGVKVSHLKENAAIRVVKAKNVVIEGCHINNCFFAIYLQHASYTQVKYNTISGLHGSEAVSGNGIHAWQGHHHRIEGNKVSGHRDGIYFEFINESFICGNESFDNVRYGLHFMFSNDDEYVENIFQNNGVGVAVMFSRRIIMKKNKFIKNWGGSAYGLLLKEIYDASIIDNEFIQNTLGIFVEGSNRIVYKNNQFIRNGWAIKISGGCEDNNINHNNFIGNSLDLVMNMSLQANAIHHNYWSQYNGYDLDKDGIGDIPFYPVRLFYYILDQTPEAIVLMRSLFVDLINYAEKVSPVFTPKDVFDPFPMMHEI